MPDHNLIELLLFYSIPRKDTNELAHKLIDAFGSLKGVLNAPYERLIEIEGMGESSALLISLIPGICRRYVDCLSDSKKINLSDPEAAKEFVSTKFFGYSHEVFYMICLDATGNLINCCKLAEGTNENVIIDKRKTLEIAIRNKADKVIFAHNHPNGIAAPSKKDLEMTHTLSYVLSDFGIRLVDHFIVTDNDAISLASIKKLQPYFV